VNTNKQKIVDIFQIWFLWNQCLKHKELIYPWFIGSLYSSVIIHIRKK
jgi:hypothetical protein